MNDAVACAGLPPESAESQVASLHSLRARIDEQDQRILRAIEASGRIVEEVLVLKHTAGFPAFDAIRERQLLERLQAAYHGPYHWRQVEQVFRTLLEMSRTLPPPY